jgi:hypothetical protein
MDATTIIDLALALAFALYLGKPRPWFNGAIPLEDPRFEYDPEAREVRLTRRAKLDVHDAHYAARERAVWENATTEQRVAWALSHRGTR